MIKISITALNSFFLEKHNKHLKKKYYILIKFICIKKIESIYSLVLCFIIKVANFIS